MRLQMEQDKYDGMVEEETYLPITVNDYRPQLAQDIGESLMIREAEIED